MPQPSPSDVHVDAPLTNVSTAYIQSADNFIAGRVFPAVPVQKQSDKYFTYDKHDWFRDEAAKRAPATESAGGGFGISTATYAADVWAWHKDVDEQTRANADNPINVDSDATRYVTNTLLLRREVQWAADYFVTGVWGNEVDGASEFTQWDDAASDPEKDIHTGIKTILQNTGFEPNTLTVGFEIHQALKRHPLIAERFKYTSPDSITAAMLAAYFEIANYHIAKAVYSTDAEGATTPTYTFVQGKHALLSFAPPSPGLLIPSAGYNFVWTGLTGMSDLGIRMLNIPIPLKRADRIEAEMAFDMKVVSSDLGYFFLNAHS